MWRNIKFYVIAFAIVFAGSLISTGLQLLESLFPEIHPLNKLAANLSGVTLGGVMMVLAFLRDSRLEEERKRAEGFREEAKNAAQEAKSATELAESAQEEARQQRERADRAEAELERLREQYDEGNLLERIRRLEQINGVDRDDSNGENQSGR